CGISIAIAPGRAAYIPIAHKERAEDLLGGGLLDNQISQEEALSVLQPLLQDESVLKIAHNLKHEWLFFYRHGTGIASFDDIMLMSYVLSAGINAHDREALAEQWLGHMPLSYKELIGSGKAKVGFDMVALEPSTSYAAEIADVTLRLWKVLKLQLVARRLVSVYERLERP